MPKTVNVDRDDVITEMLYLIHSGKDKKAARQINSADWLLSDGVFTDYWLEAKKQHTALMKGARAGTVEGIPENRQYRFEEEAPNLLDSKWTPSMESKLLVVASTDMRSSTIITRNRALEILSDIAEGRTSSTRIDRRGQETLVPPTNAERIMAIRQMTEMEGWNGAEDTEDVIVVEFTDAQ